MSRFLLTVRVLLLPVLLGMICGCGSAEEQAVSCAYLEPCEGLACRSCAWPSGSCLVLQGEIVSASIPSTGEKPFYVLIDIEVLSETQNAGEKACEDAGLVIRNPQGEILNASLVLDQPYSLCSPSLLAGAHTVTLECPEGFPTRARYRVSIADSRAGTMWP